MEVGTVLLNAPFLLPIFNVRLCLPPIIDMDRPEYYWEQIGTSSPVDEEHWKAAGSHPQTTVKCPSIFPPAPTASQVVQGGTWYEREVWYSYYRSGRWTEPAANGFTGMRSLP